MSEPLHKERVAVYPGSFDPPTHGHLNIIDRAANIFDQVIVAVATNVSKKGIFNFGERTALLERLLTDRSNVRIDSFSGLVVSYMEEKGYNTLVRGIRTVSDFENEFQMALSNKHLSEKIETVFMMTDAKYSYLSSTLIREIIALGGDTKGMVPPVVEEALRGKLLSGK